MELEFTDEQLELGTAVRTVLERECPSSLVREVVEKGVRADGLWRKMVDLGWPALTIAEDAGGLGLGWVELAVVLEELGRAVAPVPYLATVTQFAPVVREAGAAQQRVAFLGAVAAGTTTGALARGAGIRATPAGDGRWWLAGTARTVLDAPTATELAVVAAIDDGDGTAAFVIPSAAARIEPVTPIDASRPIGHVHLDGVKVDADRVLGTPGAVAPAAARAWEESVVAIALETVGACQAILDTALEHAKTRVQFGVPIGSFQAVKHKMTDMLVALEKARATGYFAALTLAEDDPRRSLAASVAKAAAGDAQRLIAQDGIQLMGGMGFTWEHDMHLLVKRAKTGEALGGSTREHRAVIATAALP